MGRMTYWDNLIRGMTQQEFEAVDWIVPRLKPYHVEALYVLSAPDTEREFFEPKELDLSPRLLWSLNDFGRGERGCDFPLGLTKWEDGRPRTWAITALGLECLARAKASEAL